MASPTTLITVAPTGAESSKDDVPALPTTLDELVATAKACEAAGAGHDPRAHPRRRGQRPTLDLGRLTDTVAALREQTSLVVQLSTGGSVHDGYEPRLQVLDAEPDSCSLTCGTVNFGDDVFMNPWPFMVELYQETQEREVVPEFELFDLGHVAALNRLLDKHGAPYGGRVHCDLVMGVPGGHAGYHRGAGRRRAGAARGGATWSATGVGRSTLAGHVRRPVGRGPPAGGHGGRPHLQSRGPGARQRAAGRARRRGGRRCSSGRRCRTDDARAMLNVKDRRSSTQGGAA